MTREELTAIKDRVAKATEGPWDNDHSLQDIPALIAEVERLQSIDRISKMAEGMVKLNLAHQETKGRVALTEHWDFLPLDTQTFVMSTSGAWARTREQMYVLTWDKGWIPDPHYQAR